MIPGIVASQITGLRVVFLGTDVQASGTTHTASSFNLGTPTSDRRIVMLHGITNSGSTTSSITIAGNSVTGVVSNGDSLAALQYVYADVSSGTSGDLVATLPGNVPSVMVVWAVYGANSETAFATFQQAGNNSFNATINDPGFIFTAASKNTSGNYALTGVTERYDANPGSGTFVIAAGEGSTRGESSPMTVTTGVADTDNFLGFSIRPAT